MPRPMSARLALAALALAALAAGCTTRDHTGPRDATQAAERACRQAVKARTGDYPVKILSSDDRAKGALVRLRDHRDKGTWRCSVSDGGRVRELNYNPD